MKYLAKDHRAFSGRTYKEVVEQLHTAAWLLPPKKGQYMQEVAERCDMLGYLVDPTTPKTFLASLCLCKLLRRVK